MGETTGIGWCDATFNPWVGCSKVSPGCAHCYAETWAGRYDTAVWGDDGVRRRTAEGNWRKPLRWEALAQEGKLPDGDEIPDGHRPRVFCASLADVFEPRPELEPWRDDLFRLIEQTPSLDWLLLTKRPEEARDYFCAYADRFAELAGVQQEQLLQQPLVRRVVDVYSVPPNIWIGTSVENARFTWRADVLREIPASVRFLSCEPLVGSLFARGGVHENPEHDGGTYAGAAERVETAAQSSRKPLDLTGIDWVIVGGESGGQNARPMHPMWARELRGAALGMRRGALDEAYVMGAPDDVLDQGIADEQTRRDGPALYFKQWGSWSPAGVGDVMNTRMHTAVTYGGRTVMPGLAVPGDVHMVYRGEKPGSGGKHLDGREWCEFPERDAVLA